MSNEYPIDNKYQHQKRVIKIKPLDLIKQYDDYQTEGESLADRVMTTEQHMIQVQEELNELKQKRTALIQQTKEDINAEREQWNNEKQIYIDEAKQQGYEEGFNKGKTESLEKYSHLLEEANTLIEVAKKEYYITIDQSEETILELAVHTAEKILNDQLVKDPQAFLPIVEAAISDIKTDKQIHIYVHPNQYTFLVKQKEELLNSVDGNANLAIYMNKDLKENSCLIEHPFGQVDASIDTQLEQIRTVLQNVNNGE